MSQLIRKRALAKGPDPHKLSTIGEILLISDKNQKQLSLDQLITHLLSNDCLLVKKCHDLSQVMTDLTTNLVHFQTCDQPIDKLLKEFNVFDVRDEELMRKYFQLLNESINLKPFKCNQILETIVIPKWYGIQKMSSEVMATEDQLQPQELAVFDEIHRLLSAIKISKFESILLKSIERKFPFITRPMVSIHSLMAYVFNIIKAFDYVLNKYQLMDLLFDKLSDVDSKITIHKTNANTEEVFNIDDCNTSMSDKNVLKLVNGLDQSISLVLQMIESRVTNNTDEDNEEFYQLFSRLFASHMLSMNSCNHLQYIWLYFSSLSHQFFDKFIEFLWNLGLNTEKSLEMRERALYSINCFLKNANFVTINTIITFMNLSSLWIQRYIDRCDRTVDKLTAEDTIFYILCQILFDIFCSIHTDLDNQSLRRVKQMNFQRIIKCKLNPLAFCSQDIEYNFLCLARHYQIGYCIQNSDSSLCRLIYPMDLLNASFYCPKTLAKVEKLCKFSFNSDNSLKNEIERFNRFNGSDESDHMMGSIRSSYSPSKTLWQNLMSDSSPNDVMDCE